MRKKKIPIVVVLILGLAILFWNRKSEIQHQVEDHVWLLTKISVAGKIVPVPPDAHLTFRHMDGKRFSFDCGVNKLQTYFSINSRGKLAFGSEGGGMTEMAGPGHLMRFEEKFVGALWNVEKASITGNTLVLEGTDVRMEFSGKSASGGQSE